MFRDSEGLPRRVIGELKVLGVGEHTSSAVIVRSNYHYRRGDRFSFKERPDLADLQHASADTGRESGAAAGAGVGAGAGAGAGAEDTRQVGVSPVPDSATVDPRPVETGDSQKLALQGLLDQLEFDTGEVTIKPEGIKVLEKVSAALRDVSDKQVKIEGHTDNVPIGPRLSQTYPSNWELSQARAEEVVRYLVEKAGVDSSTLSAVGQAETQPIASNATEEGRQKNRRVEILVYSPDSQEAAPRKTTDSGDAQLQDDTRTELQKEIESLLSEPLVDSEPLADGQEDPSAPLTDFDSLPPDLLNP